MRDQGLRWSQMEAVTGLERVSMQRILNQQGKQVARSTERTLLDAVARIKSNPKLMTRDALLLPATWTKWQIGTLMARGWTGDAIEAAAGVTVPRSNKVQRKVADAFDRVFHDWYAIWGPARRTAIRSWREGRFPADCYLWEENDTRPIPGSLHPDLVSEALEFTAMHLHKVAPTKELLQTYGQWNKPICARTAMHQWNMVMGFPCEDYDAEPPTEAWVKGRSPWCAKHDHSVPFYWQTEAVG